MQFYTVGIHSRSILYQDLLREGMKRKNLVKRFRDDFNKYMVKQKFKFAVILVVIFTISYMSNTIDSIILSNNTLPSIFAIIPSSEGFVSIIYLILKHGKSKKKYRRNRKIR